MLRTGNCRLQAVASVCEPYFVPHVGHQIAFLHQKDLDLARFVWKLLTSTSPNVTILLGRRLFGEPPGSSSGDFAVAMQDFVGTWANLFPSGL
mmetsp:Transcript_60628/g.131416  ORF Transcript_60628/g.131416 Transcript_60628/m.131416 type:complete len:93 (+) Transcript_60628:175-453(+)